MSETKDTFMYNYYDYISSIFIYNHVKTFLIDPERQELEAKGDLILLIMTFICFLAVATKLLIIIIYFFFFQAFWAFIKFIISLFRTKFKINYGPSCKNFYYFMKKMAKRIITFNFYLYQNIFINILMIGSYLFFLFSSLIFYFQNYYHAKDEEKSETYMRIFYAHFESMLLIQLLSCSFYACKDYNDMNLSIFSGFGMWILLNLILFLSYLIKEKIENVEGIFEHIEPQLVTNIVFNFIFSILYGKCFLNFIFFKRESK